MTTNQKGFSLIEILIALTLLALIGTFVSVKIFDQMEWAKVDAAKTQIGNFSSALKTFRLNCGKYPSNLEGLSKNQQISIVRAIQQMEWWKVFLLILGTMSIFIHLTAMILTSAPMVLMDQREAKLPNILLTIAINKRKTNR